MTRQPHPLQHDVHASAGPASRTTGGLDAPAVPGATEYVWPHAPWCGVPFRVSRS